MEEISFSQFTYKVMIIVSAAGVCALLLFALIEVYRATFRLDFRLKLNSR